MLVQPPLGGTRAGKKVLSLPKFTWIHKSPGSGRGWNIQPHSWGSDGNWVKISSTLSEWARNVYSVNPVIMTAIYL